MRHEDTLATITCWLGHYQDQEQWICRPCTLSNGRIGTEYETRCECGEAIRVRFDAEGEIIEESNEP